MYISLLSLALAATILTISYLLKTFAIQQGPRKPPISVNYHFTRQCNYTCGFCFHTATTSHVESLENAKRGLSLLKRAGMRKLNFAGGEPFLLPKMLGELAKYCKEVLQLESVSVVTNGSLVRKSWLQEYGRYLDIMAVSCDSFVEETNKAIGRGTGRHLPKFRQLCTMCKEMGIMFKVNTVVNRYNFQEDMNAGIQAIAPFRWKCFQVLIVEGENDSDTTLRNAQRFRVSDEEFGSFCERHQGNECFVPEGNRVMQSSYLILDEYMRFLNRGGGVPHTKSILEVGVKEALREVNWDEEGFEERGGLYDWSRSDGHGCGGGDTAGLDW